MSNKFEQLLELLINEENDKAEALFHEIVVEKSRDIYEGLAETAEETTEAKEDEKVEETAKEETSEEKVKETKDEEVEEGEEVEIEETSKEEEATNEEESIEEVGGDATDELVKDISAEEEGEMDGAEMGDDNGEEGEEAGDTEERVADLEDALDELKAEFEKMMAGTDKDGDGDHDMDDHKEEESVEEPVADEIQPMEAKHDDKKKEKMDEYKIQKSADTADHSDKGAKSPVSDAGTKMGQGAKNIAQAKDGETGRTAPSAEKMGEFANTPGKDKAPAMKAEKADTADHSDKSAKSPVASKK